MCCESVILNLIDQLINNEIAIIRFNIGGPHHLVFLDTINTKGATSFKDKGLELLKGLMEGVIENKVILADIHTTWGHNSFFDATEYTFMCDNEKTVDNLKRIAKL